MQYTVQHGCSGCSSSSRSRSKQPHQHHRQQEAAAAAAANIPEFFHHIRVRKVVHDVLQDSLVVGVAQRSEHQNHGDVRPDVRQLRADLPPRDLAVLVSLSVEKNKKNGASDGGNTEAQARRGVGGERGSVAVESCQVSTQQNACLD